MIRNILLLTIVISVTVSGCGSTGPPASWKMQIENALQAARKIDNNARLYRITAFPKEFHTANWDYASSPLHVQFDFDRPGGRDIEVSFTDTDIPGTLKAEERDISTWPRLFPNAGPQSAEDLLAIIPLSPREAGLLTWQDASVQAKQRQIEVSPDLWVEPFESRMTWTIIYIAASRKPLEFGSDIDYVVDAKSGEILKKDYTPTSP